MPATCNSMTIIKKTQRGYKIDLYESVKGLSRVDWVLSDPLKQENKWFNK